MTAYVSETTRFLSRDSTLENVLFVCFSAAMENIYRALIP